MAITAAACALILGGWSYHLDRTQDWNEQHNAVGLSCNRWSAMTFRNSYDRESYGVGYEYPLSHRGGVEYSAYAAIWSGYEDWNYGRPIGGLRARYRMGRLAAVVTTAVEVTTLHFEMRF